jgi:hypothetical protein
MEARANDRVTALSPARSSHQIVFLMLGAFALSQAAMNDLGLKSV